MTSPIAPETSMPSRRRRKTRRWRQASQIMVATMTGQWPQM